MKKWLMAPLLILGACAACCALPLFAPLMGGLLASGAGVAFGGWRMGLAIVATIAAIATAMIVKAKIGNRSSLEPCLLACSSPQDANPCDCSPDPQP